MFKKLFPITALALILLTFKVYAAENLLAEWTFDEMPQASFSEYVSGGKNGVITKTTNYAIKNYQTDFLEGSRMLKFTAFKSSEQAANANRTFYFTFPEYNPTKYPNTKLVVTYDTFVEYCTGATNYAAQQLLNYSSSAQTAIQTTTFTSTNGTTYSQKTGGNTITAPINTLNHIMYVYDYSTGKYSFTSNGTTKSNLTFTKTAANCFSFNVNKNEIYYIDNLRVLAVPNTFSVSRTLSYADQNKYVVEFNAPLKNVSLSVKKGSTTVSGYTYKIENDKLTIDFSKLSKSTKYTITIGTGTKNIIGTGLSVSKTYSFTPTGSTITESSAKIASTNAKDGFNPTEKLYFEYDKAISAADVNIVADGIDFTAFTKSISNKRLEINYSGSDIIPFDTDVTVTVTASETSGAKVTHEFSFKTQDANDFFSVYQQSQNKAQAGMGGFSVLVYVDIASPGKVYFERETINRTVEADLPFEPPAYAKVISPSGKTSFIYDFTYSETGKTAVCFNLPTAEEGIWQFQFSDSRDGDLIGIGIEEAYCWGVRGECLIGITENTLKNGYIYVPEKVDSVIVGAQSSSAFYVTDDKNVQYSPSSVNYTFGKHAVTINSIGDECYLEVNIADNFYGQFGIERAPSLLCPDLDSAEMLKGGWIETEGILCQGPIQSRARLEAIRLLNEKDLTVSFEKPALPERIDYPMAEALLFAPYGLITPLGDQVDRMVMDPDDPYFGSIFGQSGFTKPTVSWETGKFCNNGLTTGFGTVVGLDAQLNYLYQNKALANLNAIHILSAIIQLSEDHIIREGDNALNYPTTHGNFRIQWLSNSYEGIRNLLDPETVETIDLGLSAICDKQGGFRGMNTTNQFFFTMSAVESIARMTGVERHHDLFKNQAGNLAANDVFNERIGQSSAGYFIEDRGLDGQYHTLCQLLLYPTYKHYKAWSGADKETVSKLKGVIEDNIEFDSLFWLPQPKALLYTTPNCFTSRTTRAYAITTHTNYEFLIDEFPLAKRRFELVNMPDEGLGNAATFPCYVTNDEWAMRVINRYYPAYEYGIKNYTSHGTVALYNAYKNQSKFTSEPLPCEQESGIWDKNGIIAIKHKGIYLNSFYAIDGASSIPSMSYLGGGASVMWTEGTGSFSASKKPTNYSSGVTSKDQLNSSCIFGNTASGSFFFSGKEKSTLTWITPDKIFEISGTIPNTDITATWRYELTNDGIRITAKASSATGLGDVWMNIPLSLSEPEATVAFDGDTAIYSYLNDNVETVELATANDAEYVEGTSGGNLRVKLENGSATVDVKAVSHKKVEIEGMTDNETSVTATVKSYIGDVPVTVIAATYVGDRLTGVKTDDITATATATPVPLGINTTDAEYINLFIWDSLTGMTPYDFKTYN